MGAKAQTKSVSWEGRALVLIGRDSRGQAHAACFAAGEREAVEKAATTMGMAILKLEDDEQMKLAAKVPHGKLYASGRAFAPYISEAMFNSLSVHFPEGFELPVPTKVATDALEKSILIGSSDDAPGSRDHWLPPQIGQVVLATEGEGEGWFEAEILRVEDSGLFVLKWRDYPKQPEFKSRLEQLALIHAKRAA